MTDLDARFLAAIDGLYRPRWTHLRTPRALGTAESLVESHLGLHQVAQRYRWAQDIVGTVCHAELTPGAALREVGKTMGTGGNQGEFPAIGVLPRFQLRHAAIRELVLGCCDRRQRKRRQ